MITAIREVRRAKKLTLADVAARCSPPTTAQTIGRLETGTRTVSVDWLNRIADALGVTAADLVKLPEQAELPVAAVLSADGVHAPSRETRFAPPHPDPQHVGIEVVASLGEYRAGDEIWCERIDSERFGQALNRDVLVPRPSGRFVFGRLLNRDGGMLHILPLGAGQRQQVIADPPWAAVAVRLLRQL